MRSSIKGIALALAVVLSSSSAALAMECAAGVSSALDQQRQQYIAAQGDLAEQNFSKRPGTFASTTCLDNLMSQGGIDIFFKPPSLDNILEMVKTQACEQASQIFDSLVGGSGLNIDSLQSGEIMAGINLGGNLLSSLSNDTSSDQSTGGLSSLISNLIGDDGTASTSTSTESTISNSIDNVFN